MKKCCLNCSFCIRHQEKKNFAHISVYNTVEILSHKEREQALKNNFDFLGAEIKIQRDWEAQYKQLVDNMRKGMYHEQLGGGPKVLGLLTQDNMYPHEYVLASTFGMPPHPDAPDVDYLACWHDLWNFKDKTENLKSLNDKNKCLFFYPYTRKENKSFAACEKERQESQAKNRFATTNWLVILGICVTILIFAIQKFDADLTSLAQQYTQKQVSEEIKK